MSKKVKFLIENIEKMTDDELYEYILFKLSENEYEELLDMLYKMKKDDWLDRIYELLTSIP